MDSGADSGRNDGTPAKATAVEVTPARAQCGMEKRDRGGSGDELMEQRTTKY